MPTPYTGNAAAITDIRAAVVTSEPVGSDSLNAAVIATPDESLADVVAALCKWGVFRVGAPFGATAPAYNDLLQLGGTPGSDNSAHLDFSHTTQTHPFHLLIDDVLPSSGGINVSQYDDDAPMGRSMVINCYFNLGFAQWAQENTAKASWKISLVTDANGAGSNGVLVQYMPAGTSSRWNDSDWFTIAKSSLIAGNPQLYITAGGAGAPDQTALHVGGDSDNYDVLDVLGTGLASVVKVTGTALGANPTVHISSQGQALQADNLAGDTPTIFVSNDAGGGSSHGIQALATGAGTGLVGQCSGATGAGVVGKTTDGGSTGAAVLGNTGGTGPAIQGQNGGNHATAALRGFAGATNGWTLEPVPQSFYPAGPALGAIITYNGATGGNTPDGTPITRAFCPAIFRGSGATPKWLGLDGAAI